MFYLTSFTKPAPSHLKSHWWATVWVFYCCVTYYLKLSGLNKHPFISAYFYGPQVQPGSTGSLLRLPWGWAQEENQAERLIQAVARLTSLWLKGPHFLAGSQLGVTQSSQVITTWPPSCSKSATVVKPASSSRTFPLLPSRKRSSAFKGFVWLYCAHQDDLPFN